MQRSAAWALLAGLGVALLPVGAELQGLRLRRQDPAESYNEETKIEIPGVEVPPSVTVESLVAVVFVALLASAPLLLAYLGDSSEDSEEAVANTRTHLVQAIVVMVLLVGGIIAFTTTIKFQSAHFNGNRTLTIVESVYLLAQMITTVGYGDITPALPRGQVVVGFYVLCSVMLIADMVGHVSNIVVGRVEKYSQELTEKVSKRLRRASAAEAQRNVELYSRPQVSMLPIFSASVTLAIFLISGILFWHYYPGEEKTWLSAIYMSIITLSTVGFGAFTATTEGGKVFGAFWMIFGVASLVSFVGTFSEFVLKVKRWEKYSDARMCEQMKEHLSTVLKEGDTDTSIDRRQFTRFALLQLGVSEKTLHQIDHEFKVLDHNKDGSIDIDEIKSNHFPQVEEKTDATTGTE